MADRLHKADHPVKSPLAVYTANKPDIDNVKSSRSHKVVPDENPKSKDGKHYKSHTVVADKHTGAHDKHHDTDRSARRKRSQSIKPQSIKPKQDDSSYFINPDTAVVDTVQRYVPPVVVAPVYTYIKYDTKPTTSGYQRLYDSAMNVQPLVAISKGSIYGITFSSAEPIAVGKAVVYRRSDEDVDIPDSLPNPNPSALIAVIDIQQVQRNTFHIKPKQNKPDIQWTNHHNIEPNDEIVIYTNLNCVSLSLYIMYQV